MTAAEGRTVPDLQVPDAVPRRVLAHLVGHPFDRVRRLEQGDSQLEAGQVVLEIPRIIHAHVLADRLGFGGRQGHAGGARKIQHRCRPERAIQVHVQLRLGQEPQQFRRQHCRSGARSG